MVNRKQLKELKSHIKTDEEWELFEWLTGHELDEGQKTVWKDSVDVKGLRRQVILAHRGYGKSWLEGAHRFIKMITTNDWESYTVYPKREQAMYSLGYTKAFIQSNPYTNWMSKKAKNWGETKIMLPNNSFSFVISPSSRTATGYHVDWGYCGEAARWADDWDEIFNSAIVPMTNRKQGVIWMTSSAYGERGFFHKEFQKGTTDLRKTYMFDVDSTPIYNAADKAMFLDDLGMMLYRQEYQCQFLGSAETYIQLYLINKQSRMVPQIKWMDVVNGFETVDYLGLDPGKNFDKFGIVGINKIKDGKNEIVLYEELKNDAYTTMTNQLAHAQEQNPRMKVFQESTGNQIMFLEWLQSKGVNVVGVDFGSAKKEEYYQKFERNLRQGRLYLPVNNDLCMSQVKYIPFKNVGTHTQFPDEKIGGHHALHALVSIGVGSGEGRFAIRSM
jgi:hypothetical protein